MADYWKSNPRHFCEACKCWFSENKASIEFHERGKRHQENVQRRLKELTKKSVDIAQTEEEQIRQLKLMDSAALAAMQRDLKQDPKLALQYGVDSELVKKIVAAPYKAATNNKTTTPTECLWYEAKSPEGYLYYYNTNTKETTWDKVENYVSLEEQTKRKKIVSNSNKGKGKSNSSTERDGSVPRNNSEKGPGSSNKSSRKGRSHPEMKTDSIKVKKEIKKEIKIELKSEGQRYSGWETVIDNKEVDLELPVSAYIMTANEEESFKLYEKVRDDVEEVEFAQKTVASLQSSDDAEVSFKKRKLSSKRQVRERSDD